MIKRNYTRFKKTRECVSPGIHRLYFIRYMETMQKQRLEYEDLLARRLREQEFELVTKASEELKAKEDSIEQVVKAVTETKDAEHEVALKMVSESMKQELSAKYEKAMGERMSSAKEEFTKELEAHVAILEELSERLRQNEQNLEISRNFESGSQRAHRVSAAALALAEKMETSKEATEEFISLKAAAVENGVIASALSSIPNSVKSGILTVPELQATFDGVLKVGRQVCDPDSFRDKLVFNGFLTNNTLIGGLCSCWKKRFRRSICRYDIFVIDSSTFSRCITTI